MDLNSPCVQKSVEILQGIITRMAGNSAQCKTWCISLSSAILVVSVTTKRPVVAFVAFLPTVILMLMDAYYLSLERDFRKAHTYFLDRDDIREVYRIHVDSGFCLRWHRTIAAVASPAVVPFYVMIAIAVFLTVYFQVK